MQLFVTSRLNGVIKLYSVAVFAFLEVKKCLPHFEFFHDLSYPLRGKKIVCVVTSGLISKLNDVYRKC